MNPKSLVWSGAIIGGAIGNYLPLLWGASVFSVSSAIFGLIGGLAGIWAGFKVSRMV